MDSLFMRNHNSTPYEDGQEVFLTLFVGAIGPQASEESLSSYFDGFGRVAKVKIIVDWNTKQSKECALVYFTSPDSVRKVLAFPKHIIDGRLVRVEPADRTKKGSKILETPTLFVSNISYLTVHGKVIEYFSRFGQITSCKFCNDRNSDGARTQSANIRFEKQHSIERIFSSGTKHLVGGNEVCCSILNSATERNYDYENNDEDQLRPASAQKGMPHSESSDDFDYMSEFQPQGSYKPNNTHLDYQESRYNDTDVDFTHPNLHPISTEPIPQGPMPVLEIDEAGNRPTNTPIPKPQSLLLPMEHQKDDLFQIFCDFAKPPPAPKVNWEDTPYSQRKPKRKKFI